MGTQQSNTSTPTPPAAKEEPIRYTLEELKERAAQFDVSPYVVEGAVHEDERKSWTIEQAQALIKTFVTREV